MLQTLQSIQIALFFIPSLVLIAMGVVILVKPISIINRRWYLAVFLPLLIANPLAIVENNLLQEGSFVVGWRLWLILAADFVMMAGIFWFLRGWMVYGPGAEDVQKLLIAYFQDQGLTVEVFTEKKRARLGGVWDVPIIRVKGPGQSEEIWVTERFNEILIRTDSSSGTCLVKHALPSLRRVEKRYDFSRHAVGILYIVLGVVMAVLGWIFFFEPRLILVE